MDPPFMWRGRSRAFIISGKISTEIITPGQTHSWGKCRYFRGVKLELELAGPILFYQCEEKDGSCLSPNPQVQTYSHGTLPCWSFSPQILRIAVTRAFPNHSPAFLVRVKGILWVWDFRTTRICWRVLGKASWLVLCVVVKNHI